MEHVINVILEHIQQGEHQQRVQFVEQENIHQQQVQHRVKHVQQVVMDIV